MTIASCTVSRYGTMCDYARTTVGESGSARNEEEAGCKRPAWKSAMRCGGSEGHESGGGLGPGYPSFCSEMHDMKVTPA